MNKLLTTLILIVLFSLNIVSAQKSYFDIRLKCYQGCKESIANIEDQIILELSLINNFEYWVFIGDKEKWDRSSSIWIIAENSNLKDGKSKELYQFVIGNPIYVPPKSEIKVYIPLDAYNSLEKEKRIGDWNIKAEMSGGYPLNYYEDPFNGEIVSIESEYQIQFPLTTNLLKFEAKKEEVKIEKKGSFKFPIFLFTEEPYKYFSWVIGSIIILVIGYYITQGRKK